MNNNTLTLAQGFISKGSFNEAKKILISIHKIHAGDANYWFLLGICNASLKTYKDAEKNFKKAIKLSPLSVQAWSNLGLVYLHTNKLNEAIKNFKKALTIDNNFIDALYNLSVTYHKQNKLDKAVIYSHKAIKINKHHFQAYNILGLCQQNLNPEMAIESFTTAININKNYFDAWHNLIDTYILHKKPNEAEQTLKQALTLFIDNISLYKKLGALYESQNKIDEAIETYTCSLKIDPHNPDTNIAIARSYLANSKFDKCENAINKTLKRHPENIKAILGKCNLLITQRKYEDAYELLKPAIKIFKNDPDVIIAHANVCKLLNQSDLAIDALVAITKNKLSETNIELANSTLADIYDQKGDYNNAFLHYQASNNVLNKATDIQYYRNSINSIINNINNKLISQLPKATNSSASPIFIVGMPRSGTTLIEQILSSHPDVYGAGEITDLWTIGNKISGEMNLINYAENIKKVSFDEIEQYSNEYLSNLKKISNNSARYTDKLPHNFFHIGLIELLFPHAKIIHCSRHPFDTCLSIYFKNFNNNHLYTKNLKEIAIFYKHYQLLMQHWHENSQLKIYNAKYENIISNPEKNIREIVQHVDIEWDDACLKHHESKRLIMTPSHNQASKPIYTSSVNRWKSYINHLELLRDVLGDPESYL